jgi:N-acetylglucosamine-6-phosphate deacetylase
MIVGGGRVLTPDGALDNGSVTIDGLLITRVGRRDGTVDVDAGGGWIVPGFIDLQINGAHGIDVTTQPERIDELGATLVRYGVTAFVPTVITCSQPVRRVALAAWAARDPAGTPAAAVPLGLHIEGPMLSPARKGAHPAKLLAPPSADLIDGWSPETGVVLATVAPELPGAIAVIAELAARGVVVSIGHTDGSSADFAAGRAAGARYVTHLFNAMRPFSHRDPGPIGAALADDDVVVGLICDGLHVDPIAVRFAFRALGAARLNLVTDAISALGDGAGVGAGRLGSVAVTIDADGVRNADGVLAGSTLSLDRAVRNLVAFTGCAVADAVATVTSTPADLLGLSERGRLVPGKRADITVLDGDLFVIATVVGGEVAWRS